MIGVPDSYRGEAAKAFVRLKPGAAAFTLDELRAFLADKLGRHEMPAHLEFRDALPKTAVGKLSKKELVDGGAAEGAPEPPKQSSRACAGIERRGLRSKRELDPGDKTPGSTRRRTAAMVDAVIVSTARTPIGRAVRGVFNLTHGADMGGHVVAHAVKRAGIDPGDVEDVTIGCANPEGATGGNIARQCAIRAGLPVTAAAQTVNRFCSSGLQAIALAARSITQDGVPVAVAGGLESISLVQMNMNTKFYRNEWIVEHKGALYMPMIETADIVARRYGISREKQDEYSLISQQRTAAGAEGRAVRRRDRADDHGHAGGEQGDQGDLPAHRHPGARRGQPARHDARGPRQAEAGARRRPVHHRRQRQPALRRRLAPAC